MNKKIILIIVLFSLSTYSHTGTLLTGTTSTTASFSTLGVKSAAFDRKNKMFYVGIGGTLAITTSPTKVLSKISTSDTDTTFTGIGTDTTYLSGKPIEFISLLDGPETTKPVLAVVATGTADSTTYTVKTATKVLTVSSDGETVVASDSLYDADGTAATAGIVSMTTSDDFIFAAVKANGGNFCSSTTDKGGIAVIKLTDTTTGTVDIKNAVAGSSGNKAVNINWSVSAFQGTGALTGTTENKCALHWNSNLSRLYIGLTNAVSTGTNGARSIAMGTVSDEGKLTLSTMKTNTMEDLITTAGTTKYASAKIIRSMHTSTGLDYLIVNGGVNATSTTVGNNEVYAIPLVMDNDTSSTIGKIAKHTLTSSKFKTMADGTTYPKSTDDYAKVGSGTFPIATTNSLTDIFVVGDTVYASSGTAKDSNNDAGIFYSQAQFDNTGKILRWTPWTKRLVKENIFGNRSTGADQVEKFAVDATSGKVFAVDGSDQKSVVRTKWCKGTQCHALVQAVNTSLSKGCYCVLDLDQSTPNMGTATTSRYALFGGANGKVCFARTSIGYNATETSSQYMPTTFTDGEENFLTTTLPVSSPILSLGFTKAADGKNCFFAGTSDGLYGRYLANYCVNNDALGVLNTGIFSAGSWTKISGISGAVVDIKSLGNATYVLALDIVSSSPSDKIYKLPNTTALTGMSGTNVVTLAESGKTSTPLSSVPTFESIEVITQTAGSIDQLVIGGPEGTYATTPAFGINTLTNELATGEIDIISSSKGKCYNLTTCDQKYPSTIWSLFYKDSDGQETYTKTGISQLCGAGNATTVNQALKPTTFNSNSSTLFTTLPLTQNFWTDGARRFFVGQKNEQTSLTNSIQSIPFNITEWNTTESGCTLSSSALSSVNQIFWIKQVGATGIVMAGTDKGIISME